MYTFLDGRKVFFNNITILIFNKRIKEVLLHNKIPCANIMYYYVTFVYLVT